VRNSACSDNACAGAWFLRREAIQLAPDVQAAIRQRLRRGVVSATRTWSRRGRACRRPTTPAQGRGFCDRQAACEPGPLQAPTTPAQGRGFCDAEGPHLRRHLVGHRQRLRRGVVSATWDGDPTTPAQGRGFCDEILSPSNARNDTVDRQRLRRGVVSATMTRRERLARGRVPTTPAQGRGFCDISQTQSGRSRTRADNACAGAWFLRRARPLSFGPIRLIPPTTPAQGRGSCDVIAQERGSCDVNACAEATCPRLECDVMYQCLRRGTCLRL